MKLKQIGKLCEKKQCICVKRTNNPRENWIGNGEAMYFVPAMNLNTIDDLMTIWDVCEKNQKKYLLRMADLDDVISFEDDTEQDITAANGLISVAFRGSMITPFYAGGTMLLIDTSYLLPIKDDEPAFFMRPAENGQLYLIAKKGMLIEAIISPEAIDPELYERLKVLTNQIEAAAGLEDPEDRET